MLGGTHGPWLGCQGQRGRTVGPTVILSAPPSIPLTPSPVLPLFSFSPQIETSQLEPEIARATSSRTVVYNKGL